MSREPLSYQRDFHGHSYYQEYVDPWSRQIIGMQVALITGTEAEITCSMKHPEAMTEEMIGWFWEEFKAALKLRGVAHFTAKTARHLFERSFIKHGLTLCGEEDHSILGKLVVCEETV